jgi:hypothetical protein
MYENRFSRLHRPLSQQMDRRLIRFRSARSLAAVPVRIRRCASVFFRASGPIGMIVTSGANAG